MKFEKLRKLTETFFGFEELNYCIFQKVVERLEVWKSIGRERSLHVDSNILVQGLWERTKREMTCPGPKGTNLTGSLNQLESKGKTDIECESDI